MASGGTTKSTTATQRDFDSCLLALGGELLTTNLVKSKLEDGDGKETVVLYWSSNIFDHERICFIDVAIQFQKGDDRGAVTSTVEFGVMMRIPTTTTAMSDGEKTTSFSHEYVSSGPLTEESYDEHLKAAGLDNNKERKLGQLLGVALKSWVPSDRSSVQDSRITLMITYKCNEDFQVSAELQLDIADRQKLKHRPSRVMILSRERPLVLENATANNNKPDLIPKSPEESYQELRSAFVDWLNKASDDEEALASRPSPSPAKLGKRSPKALKGRSGGRNVRRRQDPGRRGARKKPQFLDPNEEY